jgi:hypothetical protein
MLDWWEKNFATLELGELPEAAALRYRRLNERAMSIGYALSLGFGKALSCIFSSGTVLKRAYEFLPIQKCNFQT